MVRLPEEFSVNLYTSAVLVVVMEPSYVFPMETAVASEMESPAPAAGISAISSVSGCIPVPSPNPEASISEVPDTSGCTLVNSSVSEAVSIPEVNSAFSAYTLTGCTLRPKNSIAAIMREKIFFFIQHSSSRQYAPHIEYVLIVVKQTTFCNHLEIHLFGIIFFIFFRYQYSAAIPSIVHFVRIEIQYAWYPNFGTTKTAKKIVTDISIIPRYIRC